MELPSILPSHHRLICFIQLLRQFQLFTIYVHNFLPSQKKSELERLDQNEDNQISKPTLHQSDPERVPEQELEENSQSDTGQVSWQKYMQKSRTLQSISNILKKLPLKTRTVFVDKISSSSESEDKSKNNFHAYVCDSTINHFKKLKV